MSAESVQGVLDDLLATLERGLARSAGTGPGEALRGSRDAIDAMLADPPRRTEVRSLRRAPEVEAFREALVDGLVRADTVNRLLRLVNDVLLRVWR